MNFTPLIIGIAGRARSGKTTISDQLVECYRFTTLSFAEPIYQAARAIFGFNDGDFEGENKESVNEYWGISPRKALQLLGTEAGRRVFGEDLWIKNAKLRLNEHIKRGRCRFVVSDVRYEDEAEFIRTYSPLSYVWHVRRKGGTRISESAHLSEQGILFHPEKDCIIENKGSMSAFARAINDAAKETFWKPMA